MHAYWPWWLGAPALAGVTIGFHRLLGRRFGVSGQWKRVTEWRQQRVADEALRRFQNDPAEIEAELRAATLAEFGGDAALDPPSTEAGAAERAPFPAYTPWTVDAVFLFAIALGATATAALSGVSSPTGTLAPDFTRLVGAGWPAWITLLGGGLLVGFGTRMAGGCTSGHGLSGMARLEPASVAATASFFGAGVVTSFLLEALR